MFVKTLIFALAAAGAATAQVQNYTSSLDMKIDPNQVTAQERAQWCSAETNSCSQLCNNNDSTNTCSPTTLDYSCICSSNNSAPGLEFYAQTMPTSICLKLFDLCNSQNVGNARNQEACKTNIMSHCGTQDPTKATTGSSSSASGSSTSASPQATSQTGGSGTASSTSSSHGLAAPTMAAGQGIAAAAAAVGVFAYFI
ncbi:hypothetical protein CCM_07013 [Cordyceps militaris CM01]|uniref:DUF7707 domain-containing protein n=2 Tax=Cordyceps militaris TaxID=73501 RepID=G3JLL9_CORMM|nr:uncharacterized protein CCM_07013 [Cordyceps militaris CM01]ATY62931.1 PCI domain-containing [Cordyceps militaris]EGX90593.1 hypothetical protein CCM_07013 [Cordyceps militaris CM01]